MGKLSLSHLPLLTLLVLAICSCSLLVHSFAESLEPLDWPIAVETLDHDHDLDPTHDADDDSFILTVARAAGNAIPSQRTHRALLITISSFASTPVLPPPKEA
jgi:hypothetical protein